MKKKILEKIKRELKSARSALIAVHVDPDGDAIGSALSLAMLLEKLGIETYLYSQDGVPRTYLFLAWSEKIKNKIPLDKHFDFVLTVDSSDLCRTGSKVNLREVAPRLINIDHHPDNKMYGNINYVEKISSVAEQIYQLFKYLAVDIDKKAAECLYVAMITDTGNFRYENTSVSTFLMAADLIKLGVETHEITTRIYDARSIPSIKISALTLAALEFSENKKVAWSVVSEKMMTEAGSKGDDLIGLVDHIRSIEGVEVAILFKEEKDKIKVNFRSKHKVNVSEIAKRFGGGGHLKAAGTMVKGSLTEVKEKIIAETLKYLQATEYLV